VNRFHRPSSHLPESPPPEVLEEIDAAWERAQALFATGFILALDRLRAVDVVAIGCGVPVEALLATGCPARRKG